MEEIIRTPWKFKFYYGHTIADAVIESAPLVLKFINEYFESKFAVLEKEKAGISKYITDNVYFSMAVDACGVSGVVEKGRLEYTSLTEYQNIIPYGHEPWKISNWERWDAGKRAHFVEDYLSRFSTKVMGVNDSTPVYDVIIKTLKLKFESSNAKGGVGMTLDINEYLLHNSCINPNNVDNLCILHCIKAFRKLQRYPELNTRDGRRAISKGCGAMEPVPFITKAVRRLKDEKWVPLFTYEDEDGVERYKP